MIEIDKSAEVGEFRKLAPADNVIINRAVAMCPFCGTRNLDVYGSFIDGVSINEHYHTRTPIKVLVKSQIVCNSCGARGSLVEQDINRISYKSVSNNQLIDLSLQRWNSRRI